jgi:hypothetical protein
MTLLFTSCLVVPFLAALSALFEPARRGLFPSTDDRKRLVGGRPLGRRTSGSLISQGSDVSARRYANPSVMRLCWLGSSAAFTPSCLRYELTSAYLLFFCNSEALPSMSDVAAECS